MEELCIELGNLLMRSFGVLNFRLYPYLSIVTSEHVRLRDAVVHFFDEQSKLSIFLSFYSVSWKYNKLFTHSCAKSIDNKKANTTGRKYFKSHQ